MNCIYCGNELVQHDDKAFCTNCGDVPTDKHREDVEKHCYKNGESMNEDEMVRAFRAFYLFPSGWTFHESDPECVKALIEHEEYMQSEMREFTAAHVQNDIREMLDAYVDLKYFYIGCVVHLGEDVTQYIEVYKDALMFYYGILSSDYSLQPSDFIIHFCNVHVANMSKFETLGDVDYPMFKFLNPTDTPDLYDEFKIDFRQGRTKKWVNHSKGKLLKGNNFTEPVFNI